MLNNTLKTIVAAIMLMGLGICCTTASAQISDAQIWDVQTANDYSGGHYENDGFFFGAEGLYWALPSPKAAVVGSEKAAGETAYRLDWTVRNTSSQWFIVNEYSSSGDDDDDDDDDEDDDDDDTSNDSDFNIVDQEGNSAEVKEAILYGYTITSDENFKNLAADKYGPMGKLTQTTQHNSWNTNLLDTKFQVGQRYSFGFMNGHNGWECQVFKIGGTTSLGGRNVEVGFEDNGNYLKGLFMNAEKGANFDDAKCSFRKVTTYNSETKQTETVTTTDLEVNRMLNKYDTAKMWDEINTWGVELNYLRRAHATRIGMFEFGLGVRYMKWNEEFGFWGGSDRSGSGAIYSPNFLDDTSIKIESDNNIVGPQLGLKWSRNTGRFGMEILAKFTAAYNAQKITNEALLGSNGYANGLYSADETASMYAGSSTESTSTSTEVKSLYYLAENIGSKGISGNTRTSFDTFTPVAELGVKFKFDLTNKINLNLGWSGIYAGNIARSYNMLDYSLGSSVLGINNGNNKQNVFMHGFVFGITLNR